MNYERIKNGLHSKKWDYQRKRNAIVNKQKTRQKSVARTACTVATKRNTLGGSGVIQQLLVGYFNSITIKDFTRNARKVQKKWLKMK